MSVIIHYNCSTKVAPVGFIGDILYFLTAENATRSTLFSMNVYRPETETMHADVDLPLHFFYNAITFESEKRFLSVAAVDLSRSYHSVLFHVRSP